MIRKGLAAALLIALALVPAALARADHDDDHGNGRGHSKHDDEQGDDDGPGRNNEHFSSHERRVVHVYFADEYKHGHCPPGLAKKHDGCLPPGHAKKHYTIGRVLPPRVVVVPVPVVLAERLGPPPYGWRYAIVDGDLVKLALGTSLVIDAIQGLAE
jgi:hypothetical protein